MKFCWIHTTFAFLACLCVAATDNGNYMALSSEEEPSQSSSSTHLPSHRRALESAGGRIAYGQKVLDDEFPFVVYIDADGAICTGSVISPRVILTSGHCIFRQDTYKFIDKSRTNIYFGSAEHRSQSHAGKVKNFFVPAKYDPEMPSCYGDVGLIELAKPLPSSIKPVRLAEAGTDMPPSTTLTVLGWGRTEEGILAPILMCTTGDVLPADECNQKHQALFDDEVSDDHFCVGVPQDTLQTTCGGDSGGPYLMTNPGEEPVQVGATNYGPSGECGSSMEIDVPVEIKFWRTWIEDTLSIHNMRGTRASKRLNVPRYNKCYSGGKVLSMKFTTTSGTCLEMCRRRAGAKKNACKAWTWKKINMDMGMDMKINMENRDGVCTLLTERGKVRKSRRCTSGYFK